MKLIIDIPEKEYKVICENNYVAVCACPNLLSNAIKNGIPLPKGHGKLKDVDKIEWYGCTTAFDCPYKERECKDCDKAECSKTQVDDIPTIIEADKTAAMLGYERNMRCDKCKYCRDVYTCPPQVKIRGCYCEPYKGKWVTEIEKCPMQGGAIRNEVSKTRRSNQQRTDTDYH